MPKLTLQQSQLQYGPLSLHYDTNVYYLHNQNPTQDTAVFTQKLI
jgi:hypothetical protein